MFSSECLKTVCIIGTNSLVFQCLELRGYQVRCFGRSTAPSLDFLSDNLLKDIETVHKNAFSSNYVVLSGYLQSTPLLEQGKEDICNSFLINAAGPVRFAEYILSIDSSARIILIGSESGIKGSYDLSYALSKSSLAMYVREKKVRSSQQLILLSPSTILDLGMTTRRSDIDTLEYYRRNHPKERFATADELCGLIDLCLSASDYLSGVEIRFDGGKFARMK